jgi:hypothetical protein
MKKGTKVIYKDKECVTTQRDIVGWVIIFDGAKYYKVRTSELTVKQ